MSNRYDDLVLHLKLDDIDIKAKTVSDSSNSKLSAAVQGADLVADDTFGACLHFDEENDYVEVPNLGLPGQNPAHTVEGWIKVEVPQPTSWILLLGQMPSAHYWQVGAESVWIGIPGIRKIPLKEWVHIATSYDGRELVGYLNGQPVGRDIKNFDLTDKRLALAKRAIATEKNFQGKMAHVRIYRRALSEVEIRDDMDSDKLALREYRRGHPIAFSLRDKDENYVLYIGDDPRDHHHLNLELRNTSAQAIRFKKGEKAADKVSEDNHHFELVFRNGVLSDKTLKMLRENKDKDRIVPEKNTDAWDVFSPGEDNQSGTVSVYFLYKEKDKEETKAFGPGQRLIIPLRKISANAGSGARGTRVELKLNQLNYDGETTPITGSRIQHLQIISHLGSRRAPLHVGFVGSNRILNDGSSANTPLVLQLMNVLKSEGDTSATYTTLTSTFTMPAVNGTAVASVASGGAAQFNVGGIVYIPPIGYLNVTAVNTASNQLTLQNLGYSVNQAPGSVAPSGNTLLTKDSESTVTLTKESEFLISFDVQSASEDAPWSLCTEGDIKGVKVIVAKTDGRYVVIDQDGNPISDVGRWKVDSIGHGQGETPVWSIKPREDIFLGHDDYIKIYISNITTSLPSGPTNLYLDYRKIPGFWDGQVVCPIEKAPLLFYDVTAKGGVRVSQRARDYIARTFPEFAGRFPESSLRPYWSSEERDYLVNRLEQERQYHERTRAQALQSQKIGLLDGQLKKEAEHFFNEWDRRPYLSVEEQVARISELLAVTASRRYIQLLDDRFRTLYVSPDLPGAALPEKGFPNPETIDHLWDTLGRDWRRLRMGTFRRHPLELRLAADMVEIEEMRPSVRKVEGVITWEEQALAEAEKSLPEIAAAANELGHTQLQYTGELRVGIGCVKPEAKLEIALSAKKDADTKPLVIRKDNDNYLTVLEDGNVGIGKALRIDGGTSATDTDNYFSFGGNGTFGVDAPGIRNGRFIIDNLGKVGIGTPSPGAKLSIKGGLHVGGESDPGDKNLLVGGKASIMGGLHVGGESDPGNKNLLVGGKASIKGGLHVGGESDPGDKNLLVGGNASIMDFLKVGRQLGDEGAPFTTLVYSSSLFVNGSGFFFSNLDVANNIGFLYHPAKHFVAQIAVEPGGGPLTPSFLPASGNYALVFKTCHDAKLHASVTVHPPGGDAPTLAVAGQQPPGGDAPTLAVAGHISERLDVIQIKGRKDWNAADHPIMQYFSQRLRGKPIGTMLRAITDYQKSYTPNEDWRGEWWTGWVDANNEIRVMQNHNTQYIAPQNPTQGGGGTVVYADR